MTEEEALPLIQHALCAGLDKLLDKDDHTGLVTIDFEEGVAAFLEDAPTELLEYVVAQKQSAE